MAQLATSEEPPWLMKGAFCPVSGSSRVTPLIMVNTWSPTTKDSPQASSLPNPSRQVSAARSPRITMMA